MASESSERVARKAGRGFLFILAAKVYFLVAGYAIVVSLNWVLDRALYGLFGLVVGAISVLDNVIVTGTIQSVSRFTAQEDSHPGAVKAAALKLQLLLGGGIAATFALAAPLIAQFERDQTLTPYLRLAAGIVFFYAIYSVFVGSANGQRRFGLQAGLDALYATIRGVLIVGLAYMFAVWGAVSGFVAASAVIVLVAAAAVGVRDLRQGFSIKPLARFALPVMVYLLILNLSMFTDLFLLKRYALDVFGYTMAGAAEAANEQVGTYVAVQQLARITYQALLAVTFVIFPLVTRSTFDQDRETTGRYISSTMRYSLVLAGAIAVVFTALPAQVIAVPFRPEYQVGSSALAVLAPGYGAFALFVVATTILNAAGRPGLATIVTAVMLALEGGACWILIDAARTPEEQLLAAAVGAAAAMVVGCLIASIALRRALGAAIPLMSLLRVGLAFGGAAAVGRMLPQGSRFLTLAECALVGVVYVVILVITAELGRKDVSQALQVVRRKRKK